MNVSLKRIIVIGAGAVGGTIGGYLHESNFPTVLVARGEHGLAIRERGLNVRSPKRHITVTPVCFESVDEVSQHDNGWQSGDVVMIATKLNDAQSVMDDILRSGGGHLPVVLATNGIHGERWAQSRFDNVISMMIWIPATHLHAGEVRIHSATCSGVLDVGPVGRVADAQIRLCEELAARLDLTGFDSKSRLDIMRWKYAKWVTNLGNTAQALVTDDWHAVARAARDEGVAVLKAAKIEHVPKDEFFARVASITLADIDGQTRAGGSTWQSYQRGKPLESRWIEGAMADLAEEVGILAPVNRFLSDASLKPRSLLAEDVLKR